MKLVKDLVNFQYPDLDIPTFLIYGQNDELIILNKHQEEDLRNHFQISEIKKKEGGHIWIIKNPQEAAKEVSQFLRNF